MIANNSSARLGPAPWREAPTVTGSVRERRRVAMDKAQRLVSETCGNVVEAKRIIGCGRTVRSSQGVVIQRGSDGNTFVSGVATCGSVWACPSCSYKIRQKRAVEIAVACAVHLARGGSVLFMTFTMSHEHGEALEDTWNILGDGWQHMTSGRAWQAMKEHYGIVGWIRAAEVTYGRNGWHPHLHVLVFTSRPISPFADGADEEDFWALRKTMRARWIGRLAKKWDREVSATFGYDCIPVKADETSTVGEYVSKVGYELALADSKVGRSEGQRHPFAVARDAAETGDMADVELYREWISSSKGRKAITWSQGLRADLLGDVPEKSDEELAAETVEGEKLAYLDAALWNQIIKRRDGAKALMLQAFEIGSIGLVCDVLETLGLYPEVDRTGQIPKLTLTKKETTK